MHLFEAALAWTAVDDAAEWRAMADRLAALCQQRLIDPATGALREFFGAGWSPADGVAGRIAEPGHQYEWAFLLHRWAALTGREAPAAVTRLIALRRCARARSQSRRRDQFGTGRRRHP